MPPLRRTYASLSLDTLSHVSQSTVNTHDTSAPSVDFTFDVPPLHQTYASPGPSLDTPPQSTVNMHDTSAALSESVPFPTPALQLRVGKPMIVKLPSISSRFRSSLRSSLHCRSLQLDGRKFPHFKPGLNLYRHILRREFLRASKKATMKNVESTHYTPQRWLMYLQYILDRTLGWLILVVIPTLWVCGSCA